MAKIYSLDSKAKGNVSLPDVFSTEYRPDLIQKAVVAVQANKRQPYGVSKDAGLQTSAQYFGRRRGAFRMTINRGMSRLPREKPGGGGLGKVRRVPQSVGGRRSHPPKTKDYGKALNRKEYLLALKSAIATTTSQELLEKRGHTVAMELPIIVDNSLQAIKKTQDLVKCIENLGLSEELQTKKRKKILFIVGKDDGIKAASSNLAGVDAFEVDELDIEELAPGTKAGRLTIWTKEAIEKL